MSTIKTTTLSTQGGSTVPVDTVVNGTAKAWVNFNGQGTVAIRRAFNVSTITDLGTGNYTVNFTTDLVDGNYGIAMAVQGTAGAGYAAQAAGQIKSDTTPTASAFSISCGNSVNAAYADFTTLSVAIFS
jgi:hypothetical protein